MKKMCVVLLLVIFLTTGCSKVSEKTAKRHLEAKYTEDFTYVKMLDYPVKAGDITSRKEYHFVSENEDDISVVCGKKDDEYSCVDSYYQYLVYEDMYNKIKTTISKYIPNMKMYMIFTS